MLTVHSRSLAEVSDSCARKALSIRDIGSEKKNTGDVLGAKRYSVLSTRYSVLTTAGENRPCLGTARRVDAATWRVGSSFPPVTPFPPNPPSRRHSVSPGGTLSGGGAQDNTQDPQALYHERRDAAPRSIDDGPRRGVLTCAPNDADGERDGDDADRVTATGERRTATRPHRLNSRSRLIARARDSGDSDDDAARGSRPNRTLRLANVKFRSARARYAPCVTQLEPNAWRRTKRRRKKINNRASSFHLLSPSPQLANDSRD